MDIIVCIKRVPDATEAEIEVSRDGQSIDTEDLTFGISEWDNFAVEEAISIKEEHGGSVTAISIGDEDSEDVLRRALAMGADRAVLVSDAVFEGSDAFATARILHQVVSQHQFDLVLTGAIASDTSAGQVGGMLAAMLDVPQVALATDMSIEGSKAVVQHEVEGGLERVVELELPALVTVQSGINEPRYVSIRGIRKVAGEEIPVIDAGSLGIDVSELGRAGSRVRLNELFISAEGEGAEILEGSTEEVADQLIERMRERGVL